MKKEHDLAKWLSGEMSPEELRDFQNSPEYGSYQRIADYSSRLETTGFKSDLMLHEITKRPKAATKVMTLQQRWLFKAAAILIIGLGSWFFFQMTQQVSETAIAGTKTTFTLPDCSEVVLNSDSEIHYRKWNWENHRKLKLDGEAFFKVAKGKTFLVATDLGNVTVVGTHFNVKARENRFEVECFEGKVKVGFKGKALLVSKGEIIIFDHGNPIDASPTNAEIPSWMQNKIRVISASLPAILAEMERIYSIEIEMSNKVPDQKFTGFLPSDDLETALEIISKTYNFKYKTDLKNNVTLIAK